MMWTEQWVDECLTKYRRYMHAHANKKGREARQWEQGQLVRLQAVAKKGRVERKLLRDVEGPYEVVKRENEVEYTIRKVGEGKKMKFRVHADRLAEYHDMMELDVRGEAQAKEAEMGDAEDKKEYEVEKILAHTGSRRAGSKKYQVRWKGYGQEDDSWVPMEDLMHCSDLVQEYELRQVGVYSVHECPTHKGTHIVGVNNVTIAMDLNGQETPEEIIQIICKKAQIKPEDIVLMWASPPCETFSRANLSNLSRGTNHRKNDGQMTPEDGPQGDTARQHDRLVKRVKQVLSLVKRSVMENPASGLENMWYMAGDKERKQVIELCSYAWPFKKTTNLWVNGFDFKPKGSTGDGRCNAKCDQGAFDKVTGRFKHFMALAVDPQRGPRGAGCPGQHT